MPTGLMVRSHLRAGRTGRPVAGKPLCRLLGDRALVAAGLQGRPRSGLDGGPINLVYDFPNLHVEYSRVEPKGVTTGFWRSVGPSHNVFVVESVDDGGCRKAGPGRLSPRAAGNRRVRRRADPPRKKPGQPLQGRRGASLQSCSAAIREIAEVEVSKDGNVRVRTVGCANRIAVASSTPTRSRRQLGEVRNHLRRPRLAVLLARSRWKDSSCSSDSTSTPTR